MADIQCIRAGILESCARRLHPCLDKARFRRAEWSVGIVGHGETLMPEISRFFGVLITINYNDHPPPHFHVRYGRKKALVSIEDATILKGQIPPRVLGFVVEWATLHREELEENWDRARQQVPLEAIEPLE